MAIQEQGLQHDLEQHMQHYRALAENTDELDKARLMLDIAECHLGLDQKKMAHEWAHPCFQVFIQHQHWQLAVETCEIIYHCDEHDALIALGNGIWLGVTFPVDPNVSVQMLHYIVDETPEDSDGAAVAAMLAHFLAETRSSEKEHKNLTFVTNQIIAQVAGRHRGIGDASTIQTWIKMYELDDIEKLLHRMAIVLDAIVGEHWWYDREKIRRELPIN